MPSIPMMRQNIDFFFKKKRQNCSWGLYQGLKVKKLKYYIMSVCIFLSIGGKPSEKQTEQEVMMAKIDEVNIAQICT